MRSHRRPLCRLAQLPDPGSRGFTIESAAGPLELFVVRRGPEVYAYRNSCPHTGATLEWQPDVFLDYTGTLIQCGLHGALFRIESGECVHGPCLGQHLEALAIEIRDGEILLVGGATPGDRGSPSLGRDSAAARAGSTAGAAEDQDPQVDDQGQTDIQRQG